MHLLFEKQVLVDVVKDFAPLIMGGLIYPFSEFATPKDQLAKRIGYQDDPDAAIKEAKALLAAAGQGSGTRTLDFMVRDLNYHKLFGAAIRRCCGSTRSGWTRRRVRSPDIGRGVGDHVQQHSKIHSETGDS
jgi:hypothetical protein